MTEAPREGTCPECRLLKKELALAKACADAAGSQMLDLQQDCIASVKLLTELRDAAAAVAALIPAPDAWPAPMDVDKLRQRAQQLREVIGRVP